MKRALLVNTNLLPVTLVPESKVIFNSSPFQFFYKLIIICIASFSFCLPVLAQSNNKDTQKEADYKKVVTERAAKIVNVLGLTDSGIYNKVVKQVANQYIELNAIHEQNKTAVTALKQQSLASEKLEKKTKKLDEKKSECLLQLHNRFLTLLKESLNAEQLEIIKDGMTYLVLPITYAAYQDMLPTLTTGQKEKIYSWLLEARELAMDEGSADDKHKVFGKYKGKINNYLSAAGYDMKKEGEEWQKRIKERKAGQKGQLVP